MLRPTMGTPPTPVGESATEEVLEDADLMVDESGDALLVDADEDEAFDSRETNALPRIDAARALAVLRAPRPTPTQPPELPAAKVDEPAPLPDATEKVSAESILGVANALLADADVLPTEGQVETAVARSRSVPPPAPRRPALPSSPTPFSVALPIRIETRPLATSGRVETLPEPAELDAWVPPTLPPRSQAIDPTAQLAAVPLARYWPLFAAAAFVGVALVGVASMGMRPHATLASAMRADEALLRGKREPAAPVEPAGPPRPATIHAPVPATRPATMAVAGRAPVKPAAKGAAKPAAKKPATKVAPKAPAPKAQAAPTRHK